MLLETLDRTVTSSGLQQVARATIKTSPKIFSFFADMTYSNKPRAICRELAANAVDSHVMAGKADLPITVWLPTLLDPVFRVRDQGLGMSHEFMMNEFMCYAEGSTKDQSNIAIGGFGIGSKSPFAYVDQYTVTSRFDGMERVYSVFKDEDDIPSIGLLGQRATAEPNGVEVSFPIKPDDFVTFEEAAFEALAYFEPLPDIKNAIEGSFEPPSYISRGKTWGMRKDAGDLRIVMGGVKYPVNTDNLSYKFDSDSAAYKLLKYGLDLRVPIGTCSVALSREALSYDDRTIDAIRAACENVIEEVAETFENMFDQCDTAWKAASALRHQTGDNAHSARAKFLLEHAKWRGQPLTWTLPFPELSTYENYHEESVPCYGYEVWEIGAQASRSSRRSPSGYAPIGSARWETPGNYGFQPGNLAALIIDDLPQSPKHKTVKKIKEFAEESSGNILVVRAEEISPQAIIEGFGSPPENQVVLTSSLPEPVSDRSYSKNLNRSKVRMFTYDGRAFPYPRSANNLNPGPYGTPGIGEIPYAEQPDGGILVVMDNFKLPAGVHSLVSPGLISWDELRFVNQADARKLSKDNWTDYTTEFNRRLDKKLSEYPELAQRLAIADAGSLQSVFNFFRCNSGSDFTSRKPLGQIFKLYQQYVQPLDQEQRNLARFVTQKLPRGVRPEELAVKLTVKQPKAWRLMQLLPSYSTLSDEDISLFMENL